MEKFMYGSKEMNFGEYPTKIAKLWKSQDSDAMPVIVNLEPGDGTRYTLMLTPCWSLYIAPNLSHFGIPYTESKNYIIVTRLLSENGMAGYSYRHNNYIEAHITSNGWTQTIIEHFMCLIWEAINDAQ